MGEEVNTEIAGAAPADTGKLPDSPTGAGEKSETTPTEEKLPFDQHPKWKEARTAAKKLNELLKANDLDDPDDLADLVARGKAVKGKIADLNQIDTLIQKSEKLDKYEAFWKDQEEKKRRETEDPDQTIARLEAALKEKHNFDQKREAQRKQAEQAKAAISSFERDVVDQIKEMDIPKEQTGFIKEFFGVGNPANEIDITDRKAVKRLVAEGLKKKEAYDQAVISAYLGKKESIPKVAPGGGAVTEPAKPKIMLKDARKALHEALQKTHGG